jgi:DNA-binding transcriptional LysR family regulator
MPEELVRSDLSRGSLVRIVVEDAPQGIAISMRAVYRADAPPGIAGRWFIERLKERSKARAETTVRDRKPHGRKRKA